MKGKLKKIGIGVLVFILLLAGWIVIGSIDAPDYDDQGLMDVFREVPDAENGFLDIAYIGDEDFYEKTGIDDQKLRKMLDGKEWDSKYLQKLVNNNQKLLEDIQHAIDKPYFKLPEVKSFADDLFSYQRFMAVLRLIILKSELEAKQLRFSDSIQSIRTAAIFNKKMRSEENHFLISYFIGVAGDSYILKCIHKFSSSYILNKDEQKALLAIVESIGEYDKDGFSETFSGEFVFISSYVQNDIVGATISERFKNIVRVWNSVFDGDEDEFRNHPIIYDVLNSLFPKYYIHRNRTLGRMAVIYARLQLETKKYCANISPEIFLSANTDNPGFDSWDIFMPDSYGIYISNQIVDVSWNGYFERHCLSHAYKDGVKTAIAANGFKKDHGRYPLTLEELIPKYLDKMPIDYFAGEPLKYSVEDRWVYSVGADYKDDKGSLSGRFDGRCNHSEESYNEPCKNSPTIPFDWNDFSGMVLP